MDSGQRALLLMQPFFFVSVSWLYPGKQLCSQTRRKIHPPQSPLIWRHHSIIKWLALILQENTQRIRFKRGQMVHGWDCLFPMWVWSWFLAVALDPASVSFMFSLWASLHSQQLVRWATLDRRELKIESSLALAQASLDKKEIPEFFKKDLLLPVD